MTEPAYVNEHSIATVRDPHELLRIFAAADDLPTLPEVVVRLQAVVNDPYSSAKDVAAIMKDDPAISTKVLKMVNSVFYMPTCGEEITQLQPAIARLGFVTVVNIALSTSVFKAFRRMKKPLFDRHEFWRHCVCVGITTSILHDYCRDHIDQRISRDMAHLSGIVHDMGKILFERYAYDEFHQALKSAQAEDIPSLKEEARFIGMGHDEAGAWLANHWKLGREIQSVVRWHHDPLSCPDVELQPLIKLVHLADYICHDQNLGDSSNPSASYDYRVRDELNLTPVKISEVTDIVLNEAENSEILLSLAE